MKKNNIKRHFSILMALFTGLIIFGASWSLPSIGAQAAELGNKSDNGGYVTKRELAEMIAKEVGQKPETISEFMFSRGLDEKAKMSDLIEILFQSNLLSNKVSEEKTFLGKPITRIYK